MKIQVEGNGAHTWDIAFLDIETDKLLPVSNRHPISFTETRRGLEASVSVHLAYAPDERFVKLDTKSNEQETSIFNVLNDSELPTVGQAEIFETQVAMMAACTILLDSVSRNEHTGSIVDMALESADSINRRLVHDKQR